MALYFFDVQSGRDCFSDQEGLELPYHNAAEIEAMRSYRVFLSLTLAV